jgi:hypothetical protein
MEVLIQYFDGCPSWETARNRVAAAIEALPAEAVVTLFKVESNEEAERLGFRGSPSILVDGKDLFPTEASPIGMSCRASSITTSSSMRWNSSASIRWERATLPLSRGVADFM